MLINQIKINNKENVIETLKNISPAEHDLHFIFADKLYFDDEQINSFIKEHFKNSIISGCSTSGEISGKIFSEHSFCLTSIKFKSTTIKKVSVHINNPKDSYEVGLEIVNKLNNNQLKHIFILSDGNVVNGTRLLEGINKNISRTINVSGGLAGDNAEFIKTYVADENNQFCSNCISAVGFYGENIITESGSFGGWDSFGVDRLVTKSDENVVYEIDNQPALDLYKSYLGERSSELPGAAMYFPLEMRETEFSEPLVRTILGINEENKSITFAGNIPEGSSVRLMKTNFNRVIEGANKSGKLIRENLDDSPDLLIMISCVGRKIVLKQLTQDEVDAVTENFSEKTCFTGFYSHGEISKMKFVDSCKLHNQTMTLTAFTEK